MLAAHNHLLSPSCAIKWLPEQFAQQSGTEVQLTGLSFLGSSIFSFLKMGVTFVFFQPSGTSPDNHGLLKMRGLKITLVSSLSTHRCILSAPMVFHISNWLKSSLTLNLATMSNPSFPYLLQEGLKT